MKPTMLQLKKNCKKDFNGMPEFRMVLVGDCATQHLAQAIRGYGYEENIHIALLDTDYNQIMPQIMDQDSELYAWNADAVLIVMCAEKLYEAYCDEPAEGRADFAAKKALEIKNYWRMLKQAKDIKIMQFNFPETDDKIFGNYGNRVKSSFIRQLRALNLQLMEMAEEDGIYLIDASMVQNRMGRKLFHDPKLYYAAKMPFSTLALPELAHEVMRVIQAIRARFKKCVVLDLDNTLWGGVVGDDGPEGIQIGELGTGHAFQSFQKWLKELTLRGIILAVCSKNDEDKAKEPFIRHPEMVLRLDDIAMFVANWEDKAGNIMKIQQTLNIGMDSIVFLDDNPFERNLVRSMIPDITVPELPEDPALYLSCLQELNLFETINYSHEDSDRTRQYREEADRVTMQRQFASYDEYLKNLEMVAEVCAFDRFHFPRIAQLTQRSNQFNLRTIRYTQEQVEGLAKDDKYITLYFTLKDKFGDHGLISVVVLEKKKDYCFVENWLMSCRVLKRGMEEFIVNSMADAVSEAGYQYICGEYVKTAKNGMVEHIYEKMGFQNWDETKIEFHEGEESKGQKYLLDVTNRNSLKTWIMKQMQEDSNE